MSKSNWFLERQGTCYSIRLLEARNKIGRKIGSNTIVTESNYISREHCEINVSIHEIELKDYSSNGTYVNDIEIQNSSKILKENDVIGIGVNDVDEELSDPNYHVYILRKINRDSTSRNIKTVIMCPAIIDLVDSDTDDESTSCPNKITNKHISNSPIESNSIKKSIKLLDTNAIKIASQKEEHERKVKIISDVVISKPISSKNCQPEILETLKEPKKITNLIQINKTENTNEPEILRKSVVDQDIVEIIDVKVEKSSEVLLQSSVINQAIPQTSASASKLINYGQIIKKQEPIFTIDVSDDELNSECPKPIKTNTNNSIVFEISDDEEFQCSQYFIQDIKQEINDFEFEDTLNKKQNCDADFKQEKQNSPVYDLINDDNDGEDGEEYDENLANWYMKLSQGIAVKQELKEEEMLYNDNRYNNIIELTTKISDISNLENIEQKENVDNSNGKNVPDNQNYLTEDENDNNYLTEDENEINDNNYDSDDVSVGEQQNNIQHDKNNLAEDENEINDNNYDSDDVSVGEQQNNIHHDKNNLAEDENKINYKAEKNKTITLIEAPRLPVHKGKLRGVSAVTKSIQNLVENKKLSIINKDRKSNRENDLKNKWLSKPNGAKERDQKRKNHDDRKEKLKLLAHKETQKRKISEPSDTRPFKKPKIKITNQNRGAFLTEISSDSSIKKPSKIDISKRRSSAVSAVEINNNILHDDKHASKSKHINSESKDKIKKTSIISDAVGINSSSDNCNKQASKSKHIYSVSEVKVKLKKISKISDAVGMNSTTDNSSKLASKNKRINSESEDKVKLKKIPKISDAVGMNSTTDNSSKLASKNKRINSESEDKVKLKKIPKISDAVGMNSTTDNSSKVASKSKRINSESEDKVKLKKIPKICDTVGINSAMDNCSGATSKLNKPSTSKSCNSEEKVIEKRPEKLRFKSLIVPGDSIIKIPKASLKPVKSILVIKSKSKNNRIVKKVRFNEKPLINYFEKEMINEVINTSKKIIQKDAIFDLTLLSERKKLRLRTFSLIDRTDTILSQILSWNADWLESGSEEVNGHNHLLMPMIHQFKSLSEYENIIFPLLKLEMWVQLMKNFKMANGNNFMRIALNGIQIEDKNDNKRIIYNCQYFGNKNQPQNLFFIGDFILMKINSYKIFGYVRENNFICNTNKSYFLVTIESKLNEKLIPTLRIIKNIDVKKLASITIELGQFNAVSRLKCSPLLKEILNPINLIKSNSISTKNINYEGYHKLNEIQQDVLLRTYVKCINPREPNITLIEGPPGTGKSRLLTNLALQILYGREVRRLDRRILICAPSNAAIDVITLQLIHIRKKMTNVQSRFNLVRFGVVDRMHPDVRMYSLTGLIDYNRKNEKKSNIKGLEAEKKFIEDKIQIIKQNNYQNTVDQDELYNLKQNLNRINCLINPDNKNYDYDKMLYPKFLAGAHIICATLPSCVKLLKYIRFFDVCIIDESTQCSEPWSLIPFQFTINSLVLIGDKQQLPAIVLSKLSKEYNYGKSLFTRISECMENTGVNNPILTLRTQYRMHPEICHWPNLYFYKNKLLNDSTVMQYNSKLKPYSIFNLEYNQNKTTKIGNISNTLEATFVIELIRHLKKFMPFEENKYGIISPYAQHRDGLQKLLKESNIIEVVASTIDSYQGNEKDVIIISIGRTEGVGFLFDVSRLNVSLTRAKRCLILCGNFSNLNHLPAWKSLLSDARHRNLHYNLTSNDIANFKDNVMKKIIT